MNTNRLALLAKRDPNCGAYELLLKRYDSLFRKTIFDFFPSVTRQEYEELLSNLHYAFIRAVNGFDPSKGANFNTYVYKCIYQQQHVRDYVKRKDIIPCPYTRYNQPTRYEYLSLDFTLEDGQTSEYLLPKVSDFANALCEAIDTERAIEAIKTKHGQAFLRKFLEGYGPCEYAVQQGMCYARGTQIAKETFARLRALLTEK